MEQTKQLTFYHDEFQKRITAESSLTENIKSCHEEIVAKEQLILFRVETINRLKRKIREQNEII